MEQLAVFYVLLLGNVMCSDFYFRYKADFFFISTLTSTNTEYLKEKGLTDKKIVTMAQTWPPFYVPPDKTSNYNSLRNISLNCGFIRFNSLN